MTKKISRTTGSGDFMVNISSSEDGTASEIKYMKKNSFDSFVNVSLSINDTRAIYEISNEKACFLVSFENGVEVETECLSDGLTSGEIDSALGLTQGKLIDFQNAMTVMGIKQSMLQEIETQTPGWLKKKHKKIKALAS